MCTWSLISFTKPYVSRKINQNFPINKTQNHFEVFFLLMKGSNEENNEWMNKLLKNWGCFTGRCIIYRLSFNHPCYYCCRYWQELSSIYKRYRTYCLLSNLLFIFHALELHCFLNKWEMYIHMYLLQYITAISIVNDKKAKKPEMLERMNVWKNFINNF